MIVLAVFVLPRFKVFFESLNATLPLPTRMLIGFTDFLRALLVGAPIGFVLVVVRLIAPRANHGRTAARDKLVLKMPVIGESSGTRSSSASAACSPR